MTAQLLKRLLGVLLVGVASLAFVGQASADFALTNTNLFAQGVSAGPTPPPGLTGPPLPGVTTIGVNPLRFFYNTFSDQGTTTASVRDVFAGVVASAHDNVSYSPIFGPNSTAAAPTFINLVGAVQGTADQTSAAVSTLNIKQGGFELIESTAPLNPVAPSTWLSGTVFATFTLGPKVGVSPGSPNPAESDQRGFPASTMNTIIDTVDPIQRLNTVLFLNGPGSSGFLLPGDPSAPQPPQGLLARLLQSREDAVIAANSGLSNATDLPILNAIATLFMGDIWATGIGNQGNGQSDWNPPGQVPPPLPPDFRAVGDIFDLSPITVPEPTSVALMGMGLGGIILAIRRRKNNVPV